MTQALPRCARSLSVFMCVCISGLLKNSGITAHPLPIQERVYLLTTATAPFCGVYEFVHIVIYQKSTLSDNLTNFFACIQCITFYLKEIFELLF